jgi:hypothetical protein
MIIAVLQHLYRWLLRLYPADFRDAYAAEMAAVFALTLRDASHPIHALLIGLRELRDIPPQALREHRYIRRQQPTTSRFDLAAARWLVRTVALLIWSIYYTGFGSPADPSPAIVSILALLISMIIAWRWEQIGGLLVIGVSLLFGVSFLLGAGVSVLFVSPAAQTLSPLVTISIVALIGLGFPTPFIIFGWLFYRIGQQARAAQVA